MTGVAAAMLAAALTAGASGEAVDLPQSFRTAVSQARAIAIKTGATAAPSVRERLAALAAVRREAGVVGRAADPSLGGRAAEMAADLFVETAHDLGLADPPADTDTATYNAYREQAEHWGAVLRAEAEGAYRSCVERADAATAARCAKKGGVSAHSGASEKSTADASVALAAYVASRKKELSTCWALLPVGSTTKIPKRVVATVDLAGGRARSVEWTAEGVHLALRECLTNKMSLWKFPIDDEAELELPLEVAWSP